MRIYGNRLIKTLSGGDTRPTMARVREAVFNIWQGRVAGCRWLDICAGNGSMGAEALCRGSQMAVAIEKNPRACSLIGENWQKVINQDQSFRILKGDVLVKLRQLEGLSFDLIYFDPPYGSSLYEKVLPLIVGYKLLAKEGEMAVEHDPRYDGLDSFSTLRICRKKVYGNSAVTFLQLPE